MKRRLPRYADGRRAGSELAAACAAHAAAGAGVVWCSTTCSTLYFETDAGDGFREPGFSKERRLEPQITIGLLTDAAGFPLMVEAFEGNTRRDDHDAAHDPAFMAAHQLTDVTVVADAGMVSDGEPAARSRPPGCRSSSARRIPDIPYVVDRMAHASTPTRTIPDGLRAHPALAGRADRPAP